MLLSEAPWLVAAEDVAALRDAGLSEPSILHAVLQASFFNYLNRVADAVDIAYDYESALPRMVKDATREPLPRPQVPPERAAPLPMRLADRPAAHVAFHRWRTHLLEREAPLSRRDRHVLVRAVALALADARTAARFVAAVPSTDRERLLADYATTLTATPWRLTQESLAPLRSHGLDDRALLDVIALASHQNTASRLELVLAEV